MTKIIIGAAYCVIIFAILMFFILTSSGCVCKTTPVEQLTKINGIVQVAFNGYSGNLLGSDGKWYNYNFEDMAGSADMNITVGDELTIFCENVAETYPLQLIGIKEYEVNHTEVKNK